MSTRNQPEFSKVNYSDFLRVILLILLLHEYVLNVFYIILYLHLIQNQNGSVGLACLNSLTEPGFNLTP